jgi:ADP-ribosylglycohydrolase
MVDEIDLAERILTGIACGDALGKMTSKCSSNQVIDIYGGRVADLAKPIIIRKSKQRDWQKGDITDDTILTLLIADSIISSGKFNRTDIGYRLIDCQDPRGGNQINKIKISGDPNFVAVDGYTNGPAIRVAGISIVYYDNDSLFKYLVDSSTLTHSGKESILGCLLVGQVYSEIMKGKGKIEISKKLLRDLQNLNRDYIPKLNDSRVIKNLSQALEISRNLKGNELCNELELKIGMSGYPCSSIVSAVVLGMSYDHPRQCLVDIVNRLNEGGDLDSTAAIAGGICCGLNGYSEIEDWKKIIEEKNGILFRDYANKLIGVRNGRYCCV